MKRCNVWPDCSCNRFLCVYQDLIARDELATLSREDLGQAELTNWLALDCAARYCPDDMVRWYCVAQKMNPWWERRGGENDKYRREYGRQRA
jgi:hypothetical protein